MRNFCKCLWIFFLVAWNNVNAERCVLLMLISPLGLGSSPCIYLLVRHSLSLYSILLVLHSLSLYITHMPPIYKGTLLHCTIHFNIQRIIHNLAWYQSHCSKCFVQSLSFLAFFRCLNHLRYCSATAVRILVCPLLSKVEYIAKRLTAFIGIFGTSLQSEHLHHHSKGLTLLDLDAQKSPPYNAGRAA